MLKIKILHKSTTAFGQLKERWMEVIEDHDMKPIRLFKGNLTVATKMPIIYIMHLSEEIKLKSNKILGTDVVVKVTFTTWKA